MVPARWFLRACVVLPCLLGWLAAAAESRTIRLRNETIDTTAPPRVRLLDAGPRSGLYLIQFTEPPSLAVRQEVERLGATLLKYVPDNAFIARLRGVDPWVLRAVPQVNWVGEYRPDHKVAAVLREMAAAGQPLDISMALAPDVPAVERVALKRAMQRLERESRTRFGVILSGRVTPAQLAVLSRSAAVLWIERAPRMKLFDEISSKIVGGGSYETGDAGGGFPGVDPGWDDDEIFGARLSASGEVMVAPWRNAAAGVAALQGVPPGHGSTTQLMGYDGSGVVVAVADSGLDNGDPDDLHPDLAGRVDAFFAYGNLEDAADEHSHGTHVAGIIAGNGATGEADFYGNLYGLGVAPGAHLVAQRMFDGVGNYEPPPTFETLTRDAVRAGAVIGSNSWGDDTQGRYDLSAAEFDALVRDADALAAGDQQYILEFSAGNAGPGAQTIGSPAVAKNVIASGASQNDRYGFYLFEDGPEAMADFSSRGPCEDGRIKPDVVAPGTWIASLQSGSATDAFAWAGISPNYQFQGGTSQSGPHVSGAAAVFVQYWRETRGGVTPSPALVKAALIHSAVDLNDGWTTIDPVPNPHEGWGRVTLTNLIGSPFSFDFVDQSVALTNSQVFERRLLVGGPQTRLKVTLTYTDSPGLPAAVPALVNDLDLELVAPDGTLYRGNAFDFGESVPNALAADPINNVEGILISAPLPGEYVVRVRATRVVEDVFRREGAEPAQDFALVVSGDLPLPGHGIVALDRPAYTAPGTIGLRLVDFDLRGEPTVDVLLTSDSEPQGEIVTLTAATLTGSYTGAVQTATGPAQADGRLQIAHGDGIRVTYQDASPEAERIGEAVADLVPPVITDVNAVTRFGRLQVSWSTDEPADSVVEYGTTPELGLVETRRPLDTEHMVVLSEARPGDTVYFRIVSHDAAGNVAISSDDGEPYRQEISAVATVLVVDQFDDLLLDDYLSVTSYTSALERIGVDYEVWDVALEGVAPTFEDLRNYPAVIWRNGEFFSSLGAQEIRAMRDYVAAGGGLFMASMELLSRLDEGGFESFRRTVLHVDTYDVDPGLGGVYGGDHLSMTSGIDTHLDFSEFPDLIIIPADLSDTFQHATNALPILFDASTGKTVGVRAPRSALDPGGRVVFFSFPFDALPIDGESPNTRHEILARVLAFLAPSAVGEPTLELDREQYTLPSVVNLRVTDPARAGQPSVEVSVRTDSAPEDRRVTLLAGGRAGLFEGSIRLAGVGGPGAEATLPAADGDVLEVVYEGAGASRTIRVSAGVDTSPPEITDVRVVADYGEAVVTWTTSEPTDGLVKYRDVSFPSNFTSYHADYTTEHELRLTGLEPDQGYSFEVVCRDPAGNTTTDNNGGQFHRFRTLRPLDPPFVDNLEGGGGNWTVGDSPLDEETLSILVASSWELGRPSNELATAAYSGDACWGTNLRGRVNDYSDTSLISPAILLSGGNRAVVRFRHNYDFFPRSDDFDILEVGGLYITTNNGAIWTPLRQYGEATDGWELEEVDLSAYLGQVVRLGWAYGLFSFGSVEHPGWLVDDIEVEVSSFVPSTIVLSNNLHQATVSIRGPINRIEQGRYSAISNAPPGEYRLEYGEVEGYVGPESVTVQLGEGQTLLITGEYLMTDTNGDGISDAWEERYFGGVRPAPVPGSDADGDGMSDLDEFMAGTNPTNATSLLRLQMPGLASTGDILLRWDSASGRGYRVLGSADAHNWQPLTDWLRATSGAHSAIVPMPTNGAPFLFRLEVMP